MNQLIKVASLLLAISLVGCSLDKSKPNIELIQDFMESPAIKAQEYDVHSPNGIGARIPPTGTVPRGFVPYPYGSDIEAAKNNKNPISGDMSEEVLLVGQRYYNTQCMVCHGAKGEGSEKATVAELMALKPPPMISDKVKGWTDGQLYHVITMGQGVMGPYATHIPAEYRWQVVNYIRHLQK